MESGTGFGAGVESPADDPFGDVADEFSQETDPLVTEGVADPGATDPGTLPVVNAEGETIGVATVGAPEVQLGSTEAEVAFPGESEDPSPVTGTHSPDPSPAPTDGGQTAQPAEEPPAETPPPVATPPKVEGDKAPAPAPEPADMPVEKKDKSGTVTHRRYVLLTPMGDGRHREMSWYEGKDGKMVKKGSPGAKRQTVVLARNQDEALTTAFRAAGEPSGGLAVRAVPYSYWGEPIRVEPEEEVPIRQRLTIRR